MGAISFQTQSSEVQKCHQGSMKLALSLAFGEVYNSAVSGSRNALLLIIVNLLSFIRDGGQWRIVH